jgi:hypothetical protein
MLRPSIQVWRKPPAFPAQWLYGLYVIVLVTGFLATIVGFSFRFRQLDASTGASDPNDFTVRCSPFVSRAAASTAPCPSFATMADAPLVGQDGGSPKSDLPDVPIEIFLREGLDRLLVICPSGYFVAAIALNSPLQPGRLKSPRPSQNRAGLLK